MKRNWKRITVVASVLAMSALLVFAGAAFAMGRGPGGGQHAGGVNGNMQPANPGGNGPADGGYGIGVRGAWGGAKGSLVAVAADVLDLERFELVAELADGDFIANVAESDVEVQNIADAYLAKRATVLAQLVDAGNLTQDQADQMLAEMADHVMDELTDPWEAGNDSAGRGANGFGCDGDGECGFYQGRQQGEPMSQRNARGARGGRWNR